MLMLHYFIIYGILNDIMLCWNVAMNKSHWRRVNRGFVVSVLLAVVLVYV